MTTATHPTFPRHVSGAWTLFSSMIHGGDETLGTTKLFREKGWIHEGRKIRMPMISGNALRGVWRRACARAFLDTYIEEGGEPISLSAFYYLTSGGALHKGSSSASLDMAGEVALRTMIPHVGLFGGAGLGKIQQGKLYVDEGIPVCRETVERIARLWPDVMECDTAGVSIRELREVHGYSKQDDAKQASWRRYLTDGDRRAVEQAIARGQAEDIAAAAGSPQQMRYEQVELCSGTVIFHRWGFRLDPTASELAGLGTGLLSWAERPSVGGRNSVGHGNLLLDYQGVTAETNLLGDGSRPLADFIEATPADAVREHVRANLDGIRTVMAAL